MRLLHLSDLHLGKSIYGYSMVEDQRFWIDEFLKVCDKQKPDAIMVAGDVYDRATPGAAAIMLLDYFIEEISNRHIPLLMIAGNHDSGERLEYAGEILKKHNVYIAGVPERNITKVTLSDKDGNVNFYLLPYLYPERVLSFFDQKDIHSYEEAMVYYLKQQDIDFNERNILIAHQNIIADGTEAERGGSETMSGGIGPIDYSVFDGFDYVALGHIHRSLPVGRKEVRYAGTPMCYHLDETKQEKKGPLLVEIGSKGEKINVETVEIKPLHKMRYEKGTKKELQAMFENNISKGEYVGLIMTDERVDAVTYAYFNDLLQKRESKLFEFKSEFKSQSGVREGRTREEIKRESLQDLFAELYTKANNNEPPTNEEYEMMTFVADKVARCDFEKDINQDDHLIDEVIAFAKKLGGE